MNAQTLFSQGSTPSLQEILCNREKRVEFIEKLLHKFASATVICLKCNIPGPVKNNETIKELFDYGVSRVISIIHEQNWTILYDKTMNLNTGPEYFIAVMQSPVVVKEHMILFEEGKFGRLFDADVLYQAEGSYHALNRLDLNRLERKCFICEEDAKICASRRVHSVLELQEKIINILTGGQALFENL